MRTPLMTSIRRVLLGLIVVATAFATTASARAAYLTLGTSNTSNAPTTLTGNSSGGPELKVVNTHGAQPAIRAEATGAGGVSYGLFALLTATAPSVDLAAVHGQNNATNTHGYGVFGSQAGAGIGVYGFAPSGTGVSGASQSGRGVLGFSSSGNAVRGQSTSGTALFGLDTATSPTTDEAAVRGDNGATNGKGYGVYGTQSGTGIGVYGWAPAGVGVRGQSPAGTGVFGLHSASSGTAPGVSASTNSTAANAYALTATVTPTTAGLNSEAVRGVNNDTGSNGIGVYGQQNGFGKGVYGSSPHGYAVYGQSSSGWGLFGLTTTGDGVKGQTSSGSGVIGASGSGRGVAGFSDTWQGVYGHSNSNAGVVGESTGFDGVWGQAHGAHTAGVSGHNNAGGFALWGDGGNVANGTAAIHGQSTNGNAVEGISQKSIASGVYGENDSTGYGVAGRATNGTGVLADSSNGWALNVNGNATQARAMGGLVKAMAQVNPINNPNDPIQQCFNSQLPPAQATSGNCGLTWPSSNTTGGLYYIDFGFQISDRFLSMTPNSPCSGSANVLASTEARFSCLDYDGNLRGTGFYVFVY